LSVLALALIIIGLTFVGGQSGGANNGADNETIGTVPVGSLSEEGFIPKDIFDLGERVSIDMTGYDSQFLFVAHVTSQGEERSQFAGFSTPYTHYTPRQPGAYLVEIVDPNSRRVEALSSFTVVERIPPVPENRSGQEENRSNRTGQSNPPPDQSDQDQTMIWTDEDEYALGATVIIHLNLSGQHSPMKSLIVGGGGRRQAFVGMRTDRVRFIPRTAGSYDATLTLRDRTVRTATFQVAYAEATAPENRTRTIREVPPEDTFNASFETVSTAIRIEYAGIPVKKIIIGIENITYTYLGVPKEVTTFYPTVEGLYTITAVTDEENFTTQVRVIFGEEPAIIPSEGLDTGKIMIVADKKGSDQELVITKLTPDEKENSRGAPASPDRPKKTRVTIPHGPIQDLIFTDLNISSTLTIRIGDLKKADVVIADEKVVRAYAIDPTALDFAQGSFTTVAKGKELWKCADFNFSTQTCPSSWAKVRDLTPGQPYTVVFNATDPGYAETGVASINTRKPIYHPDETAEIIMVVLDTDGHLVEGARVNLTITAPGGMSSLLSTSFTGHDSVSETSRGVYEASFNRTAQEGNYSLEVSATAPGVNSSMISHFTVQQDYPYDIIRSMPVTVDPWKGPYHTSITITSHRDSVFSFTEELPVNFTVNRTGGAQETVAAGKRYLTWTGLSNGSSISYDAQAPLFTPDLYALGPSTVTDSRGSVQEARPWYLAIDPAAGEFDVRIYIYDTQNNANAADDTLVYSISRLGRKLNGTSQFLGNIANLTANTTYVVEVQIATGEAYQIDADQIRETTIMAQHRFGLSDTAGVKEYLINTTLVPDDGPTTHDIFVSTTHNVDYTVDANTGEVGHIAGDLDIAALVDVADDLQWYPNDGTPDVGEWTENDVDTNVGTLRNQIVVAGDLDNDGWMDLVTSNMITGSEDIMVYKNDHTPASSVWSELIADDDTINYAHAVAVGDMDSDGDLDIGEGDEANDIKHLQNDGTPFTGAWTTARVDRNAGLDVHDYVLGDIDNDGDLDALTMVEGTAIQWYANVGTMFTADSWSNAEYVIDSTPGTHATGAGLTNRLALGDFNRDGWLDAVAGTSDPALYLYQNDGTPTTTPWTKYTLDNNDAATSVLGVAVADFDDDGYPDVVVGTGASQIIVFQNDGTPFDGVQWTANTVVANAGSSVPGVVVGDVNFDGRPDIIAAVGSAEDVIWYENDGTPFSGTWTAHTVDSDTYAGGAGVTLSVVAADIDNDNNSNILDFYFNGSEGLENGAGTFAGWNRLDPNTNYSFYFIITPDADWGINESENMTFRAGNESDGNGLWALPEEKMFGALLTPLKFKWEWNINQEVYIPLPPDNPVPSLNSVTEVNYTGDDLTCTATITHPQNNDINVSVQWWNGTTLIGVIDYNNSYGSGTLFNATLGAGNLSQGSTWKCGLRLSDANRSSDWVNSSSVTVYGCNAPSVAGNWDVTGTEVCKDQTITIDGEVNVGSGASLTFYNVTYNMDLTANAQHYFDVLAGGRFNTKNSLMQELDDSNYYIIRQYGNASLVNTTLDNNRVRLYGYHSSSTEITNSSTYLTYLLDNNVKMKVSDSYVYRFYLYVEGGGVVNIDHLNQDVSSINMNITSTTTALTLNMSNVDVSNSGFAVRNDGGTVTINNSNIHYLYHFNDPNDNTYVYNSFIDYLLYYNAQTNGVVTLENISTPYANGTSTNITRSFRTSDADNEINLTNVGMTGFMIYTQGTNTKSNIINSRVYRISARGTSFVNITDVNVTHSAFFYETSRTTLVNTDIRASAYVRLYDTAFVNFTQPADDNRIEDLYLYTGAAENPTLAGYVNIVDPIDAWASGNTLNRYFPFNVTYENGTQGEGLNVTIREDGTVINHGLTGPDGMAVLNISADNSGNPAKEYAISVNGVYKTNITMLSNTAPSGIRMTANIYPNITQVGCDIGAGMVNCTSLIYGDTINAVRASCNSTRGGTVKNVTFTLTNIDDLKVLFTDTVTSRTGAFWQYNTGGVNLVDSGDYNLRVICKENPVSQKDTNWSIAYGNLSVTLLSPTSATNVTRNVLFNMTANVSCTGGECGDVNFTLDPTGDWWDTGWYRRRTLNVTNNNISTVLEAGYTVNVTVDTTGLEFLDNGSDTRIVYWNGSASVELDRINTTAFNTPTTTLRFRLQKNISAGGADANYSVYYDNPSAGAPPDNGTKVYVFYDDFSEPSIDTGRWTVVQGTWTINTSAGSLRQIASSSGNRDRIRMAYQDNDDWEVSFRIRYWGNREQVAAASSSKAPWTGTMTVQIITLHGQTHVPHWTRPRKYGVMS